MLNPGLTQFQSRFNPDSNPSINLRSAQIQSSLNQRSIEVQRGSTRIQSRFNLYNPGLIQVRSRFIQVRIQVQPMFSPGSTEGARYGGGGLNPGSTQVRTLGLDQRGGRPNINIKNLGSTQVQPRFHPGSTQVQPRFNPSSTQV